MTSWQHHHPPHDHPDYDAYLDTLTDDDLAAMEAAGQPDPDPDAARPTELDQI